MPTLNKLEYLDETKQEIKSALNTNFNTGITDEDTFRSYVTKIDNIYTNWPKVTGEGTEVTLSNTKKGRMPLEPKGNTKQTTYTGKNLCSSAVFYNSNAIYIYFDVKKLAKTFTLSLKPNTTPSGIMTISAFVDGSNLGNISTITLTSGEVCTKSITISDSLLETINAGTSGFISIYRSNAEMDITTSIDQPQIENNSSFTSYEPYVGGTASPNPDYPQDVKVVKGDNTINVHGKNLLNVSNSYSVTTNQDVNINLEPDNYIMSCDSITTNITSGLSSLCNFYHSDNTFDQLYFSHTNKVGQITITAPVTKVKIYSSNSFNNSNGKTTTFTNLMIRLASITDDTYQPYQEQTYPLNLGTTEVCKIGTYQDSFERDNKGIWGTNIKIGKVVVDTSNITLRSNYTNIEYAEIPKPNDFIGKGNYDDYNVYCSHAVSDIKNANQHAWDSTYRIGKITNKANVNTLWLGFPKGTGLDNIKTALNGAVIYYALATPTGEEIGIASSSTLASQLEALYNAMSVDGTNIITSTYEEGNAPVIINATALMKGGN